MCAMFACGKGSSQNILEKKKKMLLNSALVWYRKQRGEVTGKCKSWVWKTIPNKFGKCSTLTSLAINCRGIRVESFDSEKYKLMTTTDNFPYHVQSKRKSYPKGPILQQQYITNIIELISIDDQNCACQRFERDMHNICASEKFFFSHQYQTDNKFSYTHITCTSNIPQSSSFYNVYYLAQFRPKFHLNSVSMKRKCSEKSERKTCKKLKIGKVFQPNTNNTYGKLADRAVVRERAAHLLNARITALAIWLVMVWWPKDVLFNCI